MVPSLYRESLNDIYVLTYMSYIYGHCELIAPHGHISLNTNLYYLNIKLCALSERGACLTKYTNT